MKKYMKKRYLAFFLLVMFIGLNSPKALVIDDCKVLASYKLYSSLDEENYICKGKEYGSVTDSIYYSGEGEDIILNKFNGYYFSNYDQPITFKLNGDSNISMLHLSDTKIKITGNGSLKFKENSFVKKVINGESVYQFQYNDKLVLNDNKKIYEGIEKEFEENYDNLKVVNSLPDKYNKEDYVLIQTADYSKMTTVPVTDSWMKKHIDTSLVMESVDGFGIVKYVKETKKESTLEGKNVILISKDVNDGYQLNERDLTNDEIANKVDSSINESLISLYDVSIYNGNKLVSMKDGKYTIKIKLDDVKEKYENYKIIYVNDSGDIEEYIDGRIDGDYIVFETSHLSQYGVIGNIKGEAYSINPSNKRHLLSNAVKISILVGFAALSSCVITYLLSKSHTTKRRKKRRA